MKIADIHTHTALCKHAEGEPEEYLAAALALGESYYGVADHCPFPAGFEPEWRMDESEFPQYRRIIRDLRAKAAGTGLSVLYGMEMDWAPGRRAEVEAKLAAEPLDYIIGSIHCVDGFCFDDPDKRSLWDEPGMAEKIWRGYVRDLKTYVSEWDFQILGHPDLPKKFRHKPVQTPEFERAFREIFGIMKERGIALEINVAGLHNAVAEIYPSQRLLALAKESGLTLTYGSDAHSPAMVGRDFSAAVAWAKQAGFNAFSVFVQKRQILLPFD